MENILFYSYGVTSLLGADGAWSYIKLDFKLVTRHLKVDLIKVGSFIRYV